HELAGYFEGAGEPKPGMQVVALLVPHAGYVYSGRTAAQAFAAVPADAIYDNIFLIGVSHRYAFEGAAVFTSGNMITPLGTMQVSREIGDKLKSTNKWFIEKDEAHGPEHSLEVQLPFIQYHFEKIPKIVPILIGTRNTTVLKAIASGLQPWFNDRNLFIISSDFSHYPSYDDACRVDRLASDAIVRGDPEGFLKTIRSIEASGTGNLATAMCGWPAGLVMLYLAGNSEGAVFRNAGYSNSGDSPRSDRDEVVGYNAIVAEKKAVETNKGTAESRNSAENKSTAANKAGAENRNAAANKAGAENRNAAGERASAAGEFTLTAEERRTLLGIAREAVSAKLNGISPAPVPEAGMTDRLMQPMGAFVTITIDGDLRGCIGRFTASDPLCEVVAAMALEAAFHDPRFPALTAAEYPLIKLEISVLSPMQKVNDISEIKIGKHGIYLKKGFRTGTLLPQVAQERGWSAEQFLGYCARDKAAIGWDGWKDKDTEIFVYEAYVFGDQEEQ
ncbi:MAG: AmmeMemoRadiSam system protein B, partial [Bacteroidales bacterium]|nr:AmmeMemoRadiSam system protein B [Bacteroidales bacterium]